LNQTGKFNRRTYHSLGDFATDLVAILRQPGELRSLLLSDRLDPAFRERLMLAVTAVNQCRYCSYAHARMALLAGLSAQEIQALQDSAIDGAPSEQLPALMYAQHWTEASGEPDPQARQRLISIYGVQAASAIELTLRLIHAANLLGNTFDYLLYRLSFGRWGYQASAPHEQTNRVNNQTTAKPDSISR